MNLPAADGGKFLLSLEFFSIFQAGMLHADSLSSGGLGEPAA
jgi:hypothetical protein